jgi:hypothetical protein
MRKVFVVVTNVVDVIHKFWTHDAVPSDAKHNLCSGMLQRCARVLSGVRSVALDVHIWPNTLHAEVGTQLQCYFQYFDADDDPVQYTLVRWYNQYGVIGKATTQVYTIEDPTLTPVTCCITTGNAKGTSAKTCVDYDAIDVTPAAVNVAVTQPGGGMPSIGQELICNFEFADGNVYEGDTDTAFKWYGPDGIAIAGATAQNYTETRASISRLSCSVRPGNVRSVGQLVMSDPVDIDTRPEARDVLTRLATAPNNPNAVAVAGSVLTCEYTFFDANNDAETPPLIQWWKQGNDTARGEEASFTVPVEEGFKSLYCTVIVTTEHNDGLQVESPQRTVDLVPVAEQVYIESPTFYASIGQTLTCTYDYKDGDGDIEDGTTFVWKQVAPVALKPKT